MGGVSFGYPDIGTNEAYQLQLEVILDIWTIQVLRRSFRTYVYLGIWRILRIRAIEMEKPTVFLISLAEMVLCFLACTYLAPLGGFGNLRFPIYLVSNVHMDHIASYEAQIQPICISVFGGYFVSELSKWKSLRDFSFLKLREYSTNTARVCRFKLLGLHFQIKMAQFVWKNHKFFEMRFSKRLTVGPITPQIPQIQNKWDLRSQNKMMVVKMMLTIIKFNTTSK